jgi:hypothetical protein
VKEREQDERVRLQKKKPHKGESKSRRVTDDQDVAVSAGGIRIRGAAALDRRVGGNRRLRSRRYVALVAIVGDIAVRAACHELRTCFVQTARREKIHRKKKKKKKSNRTVWMIGDDSLRDGTVPEGVWNSIVLLHRSQI